MKKLYKDIASIIYDCSFNQYDEYDGSWFSAIDRDVLIENFCKLFESSWGFDKDKFIAISKNIF